MRGAGETKALIAQPVMRELELTPDDLLRALLRLDPARRTSILDSGGVRPPDARFLIAGFDPFEIIEARGEQLRITRRDSASEELLQGDVLALLDERLQSYHAPPATQADAPLPGACIATFSYELGQRLEAARINRARRTLTEPDAVLAFYDTLVIHDYLRGTSRLVSRSGPERLEETHRALCDAAATTSARSTSQTKADLSPHGTREDEDDFKRLPPQLSGQRVASNFTRDEYLSAVERIKEHIAAGDIYQANLTQQLSVDLSPGRTPESIFLRLRRDHPASFAAFIRRREDVVVSASPERFLRVEAAAEGERQIEAWPIKGTRPRGASEEEDARLRLELQQSEKDRAENVMIVDLMRNDLGRVCRYGSVRVEELCTIQEHPTLFHLVSKVRGTLREEVRASGLLRAAFPCGSITGAPKLRAMEIIDEVETVPRGLSMGATGYFSFDGRMDLSVAIRTMTLRRGLARFNVGGGVVADSDPAQEYEESLTKALALLRALQKDEG
ncbi:MAG TPA: aminodeoxychorismate synthase component I [Pyrinomonadaceae bacterium]